MCAGERDQRFLAAGQGAVLAGDVVVVLEELLHELGGELEAGLIGWALKASKGNKSKAAHLLGVKRSTLGDRIQRCGAGGAAKEASDA